MTGALKLPDPIAAYFEADRMNADAVGRCFTGNAIVRDEGKTHTGVEAIKQWKTESSGKYTYTCEPIRTEQRGDGATVVTCHLEGDFPGGEIDLRYAFQLERGKIAVLEIAP